MADIKPCRRGHHQKRKKGARRCFDRQKNNERHRQQASKENIRLHPPPTCTSVIACSSQMLPHHWQKLSGTHYCKVEESSNGLGEVTRSVVLDSDFKWYAYVSDKKVPATCEVFARISPLTEDKLLDIITAINNAFLCPGNPDERFVLAIMEKGGSMKGARGNGDMIVFVDHCSVTDDCGKQYQSTVRRVDCELLCERSSQHPLRRCRLCQSFWSTLRSLATRQSTRSDRHTSASSHIWYRDLTSAEKDDRMKNLHRALKVSNQRVKRLLLKVDHLISSQSMCLQDSDAADICDIVTEVSPVVEDTFPPDSPQRILWDQQKHYNSLRDKRQMRWHPLVIRFALNLKYLSGTAYRALHQSEVISLPSEDTLSDYTHWTTPHAGIQLEFIEQLQSLLQEDVPCGQHHSALSVDEMKIKSGLVFNKHTGSLSGFVDLGATSRDIELAVHGALIAEQVFAFMARAVFKPSLFVPIAHYFSASLKGKCIQYTARNYRLVASL